MKNVTKLFVQCECSDPSHLIVLQYDPEFKQLNLSNQMNHYLPWYKRVWTAITFVFKFHNRYDSHWDSTLLYKDKIQQLNAFFQAAAQDVAIEKE